MQQACERCGAFAPLAPVARRELCEACHGRLKLARGKPTVSELLATAWTLLQRIGLKSAAILGLSALPQAIVSLMPPGGPMFAGLFLGALLVLFGMVMVVDLAIQAASDVGEPSIAAAARTARRRFLGYLGLQLWIGLEVGIFALACLVPGVVRWVRLVHAGAVYLGTGCSMSAAREQAIATSMGSWADLFVGALVVYLPILAFSLPAEVLAGVAPDYPEYAVVLTAGRLILGLISSMIGALYATFTVAAWIGLSPTPEWAQPEDPGPADLSPALDSPV